MPFLKFTQWFSGNQAEGAIQAGEIRNFSPQRAKQVLETGKAVIVDENGEEQRPPHEAKPDQPADKEEPKAQEKQEKEQPATKEEKSAPKRKTKKRN